MLNTIFLRRSSKLLIHAGSGHSDAAHIAALLKNIESLGYTLSYDIIEALKTYSYSELELFYKSLIKDLREMLGANVIFNPMYPYFPDHVMNMSEAELYLNAIIHYVTGWLPNYKKEERPALTEFSSLKVIQSGTEDEFKSLIKNLIAANSSISETDKSDIEWAVLNYSDNLAEILPESIPQKETIAYLAKVLITIFDNPSEQLKPYFKTATDVLRLAVALSDGDISLAIKTKFKNFSRPVRKVLLTLLENAGNITEDMLRHEGYWIRLGERLHPSEFSKKFPKTHKAFDVLRNNLPFSTFNSKVEQLLLNGKSMEAADLLKSRPGDMARRLDHLLRAGNADDAKKVLEIFSEISENISTPVLLQVMTHFKYRNTEKELRSYFPKGSVAKVKIIEDKLPLLSPEITKAAEAACRKALINRFAKLPALGKVYLDDKLKNHLVPFSQRSAGKALRTLVRGSRLDLPKGNTIRFFLWWKEGLINGKETGRVDIDLSSVLFNSKWRYMEHISYTNLKSEKYQACHSGDITSAPNGACEFIDIDIPSVLKYGGRFIIMNVYSFTSHAYCDLPECFAGWMMRQEPGSGEIFEPKTVVDKVDLSADTKICIPVILDLEKRQLIWSDIALNALPGYNINVESNLSGVSLMGFALSTLSKTSLYDLFEIHIEARGQLTEKKNQAEIIFSENEGITPFDIEKIMADFMA
jgi:hypothetical protein